MASNLEKVKINFATEEQLQKLTGVGNAVAKNILQHRAVVGNVTLSNVGQIKYLRVTQDFIDQTDFSENPELHIHEDIVEKNEKVPQGEYSFQPFNVEMNTSDPGLDDLISDDKIDKENQQKSSSQIDRLQIEKGAYRWMDRNSQSSPLLASGGSQNVDQGIDRRGQFFPIEQSKEMNGVKFKYPTDSKQKYVSTDYPMYTNMIGGP